MPRKRSKLDDLISGSNGNKFQGGGTNLPTTPDFLKPKLIQMTNPTDNPGGIPLQGIAPKPVDLTTQEAQRQHNILVQNARAANDFMAINHRVKQRTTPGVRNTSPNSAFQNQQRLDMNTQYAASTGDRVNPTTGNVEPSVLNRLAANPTVAKLSENIVEPMAAAYLGGGEELAALGGKMLLKTIGKGSLENQARVLINNGVVKGFSEAPLMDAANVNYKNLKPYLKDIVEQSRDINSYQATKDTYGDPLLDIAAKMHPQVYTKADDNALQKLLNTDLGTDFNTSTNYKNLNEIDDEWLKNKQKKAQGMVDVTDLTTQSQVEDAHDKAFTGFNKHIQPLVDAREMIDDKETWKLDNNPELKKLYETNKPIIDDVGPETYMQNRFVAKLQRQNPDRILHYDIGDSKSNIITEGQRLGDSKQWFAKNTSQNDIPYMGHDQGYLLDRTIKNSNELDTRIRQDAGKFFNKNHIPVEAAFNPDSESARFNSYTDNEIVGNKDLLWKGGMDPEKADFRPYNKQTEKTMQQEYIDNMKNYYESPEFNRIMDEEYPEVDKEMYKQKTLDNLQNPLTFSQDKVSANASGTYYSKNSSDALYTPNHKPSFKQRIANANTRDPSMSYDFSDKKGKSFVKHFRAVDHELGHQRTNSNELIPSFLTRDFLQDNFNANAKANLKAENAFGLKKEFGGDYHANPTEFEVRMRQLKTDLKNKGIADYFQRPIKPDDIYNLIDAKVGISKDTNDLLSFYSPEFLAKMAKVVPVLGATVAGGAAALKTGSGTDKYAKGGIVRRKFQKGGRTPIPGTPAQAKAYSDSLNLYNLDQTFQKANTADELTVQDIHRMRTNGAQRDLTAYGDLTLKPALAAGKAFMAYKPSTDIKPSEPSTLLNFSPFSGKMEYLANKEYKKPVQPITVTPTTGNEVDPKFNDPRYMLTSAPGYHGTQWVRKSVAPKPIPLPGRVQGNTVQQMTTPVAGNVLPQGHIEMPNQPTNWSFTSRDENEPFKQSTQFFKSYDDYKKYTDDPNLRFISKDETADKSFAQGAGYSKFQSGGLTSDQMRNWNGVVNYAKTQNLDPNVLNHDPTIGFGIIDQYNKANPGAQFPRDSVNAIQSMMQQYRTDAITRMKASPIPENNFGPNYENFMPGLSAPDNFPGSKTLGWNIPEAYMQNTNAGVTTKTDVGLAPKVKFSKGGNTKTTNMKRMTRKKIIPYYVGGGGTPTATVDNGGDTGKDLSAEDIASYLNSGESIVTDAAGLLGNKSMYKGANTGKLIGNTLGTGLGALVGGPLGAKIGGTVLGAVGNIIGSGNDARKMGQVEEDRLRRQYGTMNINTNLNPYGTTFQEGGVINKTGYTPGTESYNNPMNIIPGGDITMKNTPFPVMAHPSNGNPVMMQPGSNYKFDGAKYVAELPMRRDPRFNMQTEDGSTNASYKMGNGKAITAGYDGGFNAGLRFNFEAGGSVNNDNQQPPQMPPQDPQQPQQQTQINIERGELMVNPQDMSVIKDFSNKNRYSAHKSKQFMEPMGNFVNVPQGAVIIPKKLAMRYKNGDMLSRKSILLQILSDQASDPMHNVPEEQQPQEQQQPQQQDDSGQQDSGQDDQQQPQAKKGGRFMGINPAHKGFETGQEYDLDESEISSLIAQGYQIQRL